MRCFGFSTVRARSVRRCRCLDARPPRRAARRRPQSTMSEPAKDANSAEHVKCVVVGDGAVGTLRCCALRAFGVLFALRWVPISRLRSRCRPALAPHGPRARRARRCRVCFACARCDCLAARSRRQDGASDDIHEARALCFFFVLGFFFLNGAAAACRDTYTRTLHTRAHWPHIHKHTLTLIDTHSGEFPAEYIPTICDNFRQTLDVDGKSVSLSLWDTAGQESYERLRPMSYRGADVFVMCFSTMNQSSFDNIPEKVRVMQVQHECVHND